MLSTELQGITQESNKGDMDCTNISMDQTVQFLIFFNQVTHQPAPYSDCIDQQYLEEVDAPVGVSHEILQFMYNDQDAYSLCQQENIVRSVCKCGKFQQYCIAHYGLSSHT